ncbi:FAD/NAD-P-binding domain-containing protein [Trametes polyzona]|nr:FAD/NAD-P-binding domain-containing protein [Trametes polyzona]
MPRFNVAIVGGGLCGLVLALALEKYAPDVDYQIYEAAAELTTAGAGIGIQHRTMFVLRELGLEPALLKISGNGQNERLSILYRKSDQKDGFTFHETDASEPNWTFHRGELQRVFIDHIRHKERIHLRKRFVSFTPSQDGTGPIELAFEDGSKVLCDVLVGADGIKSGVRAAMYARLADVAQAAGRHEEARSLRSRIPAVFSGNVAYRGLLARPPAGEGERRPLNMSHVIIHMGKNKHVVTYPISQGRILNVAAIVSQPELAGTVHEGPWTVDVAQDEAVAPYVGWEPDVEEFMQSMGSWSKWAINVVKDLPTFVDGRTALVGDAAHSMAPFQGAGAGQGFEDVLMLGMLLGHPSVRQDNVQIALAIYDQTRRPVAQKVAAVSLETGFIHSMIAPGLEGLTPELSAAGKGITEEQLKELGDKLERLKDWRRGTTTMADCQTALRMVGEAISGSKPRFEARL